MRTKLACVAVAAASLLGACAEFEEATSPSAGGLSLASIRPSAGPVSLSQSRPAACSWCTAAFAAEVSAVSPSTLANVNLWLDGWSGDRRCLTSQHDTPADGFTLVAGEAVTVGFHEAAVDCAPPFTVDRVDVRLRSGDTLVYQGSWKVALSFVN
jgi:hypothetical protein